ncbi:MAG: hypothetical protein NC489_27665 [Ruminococcus flavefaciens]|nr:hypothetical protein [Ruminococcus flavefaciens]
MKFKYYEIWRQRKYCVVIPEDISELWVIHHLLNMEPFGFEINIIANRQGFEAICNACALLSENSNIIVYFPCKKNKSTNPIYSFENIEEFQKYEIKRYEFMDLVFMKSNTLKISDWKEIRNRISSTKAKELEYDFTNNFKRDFKYEQIKEKYKYREKILKEVFRFDTAFCNFPWHEYIALEFFVEDFLSADMEERFFEAVMHDSMWRVSDEYQYVSKCYYDTREIGVVFWDNDIFQKVEECRKRMESNCAEGIS